MQERAQDDGVVRAGCTTTGLRAIAMSGKSSVAGQRPELFVHPLMSAPPALPSVTLVIIHEYVCISLDNNNLTDR